MRIEKIGNLTECPRDREIDRVYNSNGLAPTINTCGGGGREPKVVVTCASRQRGVPPNTYHKIEVGGEISNCLTRINTDYMIVIGKTYKAKTMRNGKRVLVPYVEVVENGVKILVAIRKLTEFECMRLMGVSEENIDKLRNSHIRKTHIYKAAGNSIVVHNLYYIFERMFYPTPQRGDQLKLFEDV